MSIQNKINTAVIGATGYTGLDLIFLLSKHPRVRIQNLCATKSIGKSINFFDRRIKRKYDVGHGSSFYFYTYKLFLWWSTWPR